MILPGTLTSPVAPIVKTEPQPRVQPVYVFVDADGKELRREPKPRGRTKAGAIEQSTGVWVVREGSPSPAQDTTIVVEKQQSWYIYVDTNGNEIRREKKGRGRVKKEAIQKSTGMWYIVEGATRPIPTVTQNISTVVKNATTENHTDEIEPLVELPSGEVVVEPIIRRKKRNPTSKITLDTLTRCMKPMSSREDGNKIIFFGVSMISSPPGLDGVEMNDVYHEVTVDKVEKSIGFLPLPEYTELVFVNALA